MKTVRCDRCKSEIPIVPGRRVICLNCGTDFGHPQPAPLHQTMSEFCPRCGCPLKTAADPGRLCEACGWFGDWQEALPTPPRPQDFNLVLAVLQSLELFREVCRKEQIVESYYDAGQASDQDVRKVRESVNDARQALVTMFTELRRRLPRILLAENGSVPWPEDWTERHFNASKEPCDALIGHCSCGAFHTEKEGWVQAALQHHDAIILRSEL